MNYHAKLLQHGEAQAVELPEECRFEGQDEVLVRREGQRVVIEPIAEWPPEFVECLGAWDEPIERPTPSALRDPFG